MLILEVCVDSIEGVRAAIDGGADRIELCSSLELGGLTPSYGFMKVAHEMTRDTSTLICALLRPRPGDFVYSKQEVEVMLYDIAKAKELELAGVVLGASLSNGQLDEPTLETLVKQSEGLSITLHRAFDLVPNMEQGVETAIRLKFDRILTSGRAKTALEGIAGIQQAIKASNGIISIMPGSGVNSTNIAKIVKLAPSVHEIHSSCSKPVDPPTRDEILKFGLVSVASKTTDVNMVKNIKTYCQTYESSQ